MQRSRKDRDPFTACRCFLLVLGLPLAALSGQQPTAGVRRTTDSVFYRAMDLENAGKTREAAILYREALSGASAVNALLGLERVYAELNRTDSLLAPLDSLIRARPAEPIFRTAQLRSLQTLGLQTKAADAFERWVSAAPGDATPYREYARLLIERDQVARADTVLKRAESVLGGTRDIKLQVAQTNAALGRWNESAKAWREALMLSPFLEQAAAYALAPAPSSARDSIRAAFFAPPALVGPRRALALLETVWGTAANGWLALRDLPPDSASVSAWLEFAQRSEAEERWTHARQAFEAALRARPSPDLALRAASAALNSGDPGGAMTLAPLPAGAVDSARAARSLVPLHIRARAAMGRAASAEQMLRSYQKWLTPTTRAALARSIAFGWARSGEMTRARSALAGAGPEADSSDAAGWLALYEGDLKSARRLLRAGGDASSDLARALAMIARVEEDSAPQLGAVFLLLARADTAQAIAAMIRAADRFSTVASLLLYTAGQLHAERGADVDAIPLWQRVVEQYATSAEAPAADLEWARAARRAGNSAVAVQRLEHLILSYPGSALVPQARRDLDIVRNNVPGVP